MIGRGLAVAAVLVMMAAPLSAQVRTIDPNEAIDSDLPSRGPQPVPRPVPTPYSYPTPQSSSSPPGYPAPPGDPVPATQAPATQAPAANGPPTAAAPAGDARAAADARAGSNETFHREELLAAGERTFGRGAAGLGGILERTLREQGEPNAYIAGREGSGAFVFGLRYGAGTLYHRVEGQQRVHWTGPSLGFDIGGDANKVFVLVYNLYDSEDLFRRFPAAEGRLYFVGGFAATYLRRGNIVLIPIRLGVGWRQGVNLGYMKFTHHGRVIPF